MAADAFSKIITTISVKTSSSLEKNKIKLHIENLEKEIEALIRAAGEEGYRLWAEGDASTQSLVEKFKAIQEKKEQIQQLNAKMAEIDELDSQILGAKKEEPVVEKKSEEEEEANEVSESGETTETYASEAD